MSDELNSTVSPATNQQNAPEPGEDFSPSWGIEAPRGGKTVLNRMLKEGGKVPLFFGQTLIQSLRDLGYNSTTSAICEHIDNAIDAKATVIRVYFHQTGKGSVRRIDAVVYDNGCGMAPNVLKVAMAFGGSMVFENRTSIGRYGMGMKAAALNITRSFDVYSWQETGQFYSMTLDVDAIGKKRSDSIELDDPRLRDELPSEVADVLTKYMNYPAKGPESQNLFADKTDDLTELLGSSGTIVYMPNCDRLTAKTDRGLAQDALQELGRVYRHAIADGVKIYVNNRLVEAFDPTYWMPTARHTKVEGLTVTRSNLVDSWTVQLPQSEGNRATTEVRVRVFMLPVESWSALPMDTQKNKLDVFEDHTVSFLRNRREVDIGAVPRLNVRKHPTLNWCRVEIEFTGEADEGFGVSANKQGVRLKQYVADAIRERLDGNIARVRAMTREAHAKVASAQQAGQANEAERLASEMESVQRPLPTPPEDTPEQKAALDANLHGLAVSLRQETETEQQAFERVKASKYLTDFRHLEYAPFYDTEYKFGKYILRINTAHPFYQKVWQPLSELCKKAATADGNGEDGIANDVAATARNALTGLQLMFLALARAQADMTTNNSSPEQAQLFKNLRTGWSQTLETQFVNV